MGEAGWHFVFEINEDDDRIFKKMAARDARRYVGRPIIPIVCAGLCGALIIAMLWGVLSLGAVLTGEASFAVGYLSLIIATFTAAPRMQSLVQGNI